VTNSIEMQRLKRQNISYIINIGRISDNLSYFIMMHSHFNSHSCTPIKVFTQILLNRFTNNNKMASYLTWNLALENVNSVYSNHLQLWKIIILQCTVYFTSYIGKVY